MNYLWINVTRRKWHLGGWRSFFGFLAIGFGQTLHSVGEEKLAVSQNEEGLPPNLFVDFTDPQVAENPRASVNRIQDLLPATNQQQKAKQTNAVNDQLPVLGAN